MLCCRAASQASSVGHNARLLTRECFKMTSLSVPGLALAMLDLMVKLFCSVHLPLLAAHSKQEKPARLSSDMVLPIVAQDRSLSHGYNGCHDNFRGKSFAIDWLSTLG
jgi:hypothetical protein